MLDLCVVNKLLDTSQFFLCVVAPWCRQCKSFESEFNQVATTFQRSNIRLAKVDGTVETKLVERFQVCHVNVCNTVFSFSHFNVGSVKRGSRSLCTAFSVSARSVQAGTLKLAVM